MKHHQNTFQSNKAKGMDPIVATTYALRFVGGVLFPKTAGTFLYFQKILVGGVLFHKTAGLFLFKSLNSQRRRAKQISEEIRHKTCSSKDYKEAFA